MKRSLNALAMSGVLLAGVMAMTPAHADDENEDACGAVLCLAGLIAGGSAGGDCKNYMTGYFSIVKIHRGHFDETGTTNARSDFTNQCKSVGPDTKKGVNDRYGNVQSGP